VIFRAETVAATLATVRAWVGHKGFSTFIPVFQIRIRIESGFNQVSGSRPEIRNPNTDPGGHKGPTKVEKNQEISIFERLDVLF
jgi:hypothetical protein